MNVHMYVGIQCSYIHVHAPNLVLAISYYYGLLLQKNADIMDCGVMYNNCLGTV